MNKGYISPSTSAQDLARFHLQPTAEEIKREQQELNQNIHHNNDMSSTSNSNSIPTTPMVTSPEQQFEKMNITPDSPPAQYLSQQTSELPMKKPAIYGPVLGKHESK
ncbi:unnamed protein product [[Candida] boidinii]|nr:unnamed protein product [[Candida] boidinii]